MIPPKYPPIWVFHNEYEEKGTVFHATAVAFGTSKAEAESAMLKQAAVLDRNILKTTSQRLFDIGSNIAHSLGDELKNSTTTALFGPAAIADVCKAQLSGNFFASHIDVAPLDGSDDTTVPAALVDLVFGGTEDNSYAILDGTKIFGLKERLESSGMAYTCLYSGDAAEEFADIAPYIVQIEPENALTRAFFSLLKGDEIQNGLWGDEAGIILRSPVSLAGLRRHFRHFTYLTGGNSGRTFFRFYAPVTLRCMIANMEPEDLNEFGEGIYMFLCADSQKGAFILSRKPAA